MITATAFTVTVSRNSLGGQWYIERSDMPETNIRVPYRQVANYAFEGGFEADDISALEQGQTIIADGEWAAWLWQFAEAYEG
ncbi:MAG: hypothetical protein F6K36_29790 [Symploca sp. SIO3C6]|nr:hypothetical protein [Symploca sp. SIO3C6]